MSRRRPKKTKKKKKKVYLRSSDGERMEAEEWLMAESGLIRSRLTKNTNSNADILIDLNNVSSATLSLVIDYCRNRPTPILRDHFALQQILNAFDHEFITTRVHTLLTLLNLKLAAERLEIQSLLNLTLRRIGELDSDGNLERQRESADWDLIILAVSVILLNFILISYLL